MPELPGLTKVQQVRALEASEARRGYPVQVRGVITFHNPGMYLTFVQDDSGGIYVAANRDRFRTPGLQAGQWVEVEGVTGLGSFAPIINGRGGQNAVVRVLGDAPFPKPAPLPSDPVLQVAQHCQWTEALGTVRASSVWQGLPVLEMQAAGGRVRVVIPGLLSRTNLPAHWIGARIKVNGVLTTETNAKGEPSGIRLFAPSPDWVEVAEAPPADLFSLPVRSAKNLLRFSAQQKGTLVHVKGVVTYPPSGRGFFIGDYEGGILVKSTQTDPLELGRQVEVVGFPSVEGGFAILEDAIFRTQAVGPAPEPLRLSAEGIISGGHHAEAGERRGDSPRGLARTRGARPDDADRRGADPRAPGRAAGLEGLGKSPSSAASSGSLASANSRLRARGRGRRRRGSRCSCAVRRIWCCSVPLPAGNSRICCGCWRGAWL